jgi:hypothetical protein
MMFSDMMTTSSASLTLFSNRRAETFVRPKSAQFGPKEP